MRHSGDSDPLSDRVDHRPRHLRGRHGACRARGRADGADGRAGDDLRRGGRAAQRPGEHRICGQPARRDVQEHSDLLFLQHRQILHGGPGHAPDDGRHQHAERLSDDPDGLHARAGHAGGRAVHGVLNLRAPVADLPGGHGAAHRRHRHPDANGHALLQADVQKV